MELKILKKPIKEPKGREGTPVLRDRKQKKVVFFTGSTVKKMRGWRGAATKYDWFSLNQIDITNRKSNKFFYNVDYYIATSIGRYKN